MRLESVRLTLPETGLACDEFSAPAHPDACCSNKAFLDPCDFQANDSISFGPVSPRSDEGGTSKRLRGRTVEIIKKLFR